eukprot:gene14288-15774_t
MKERSESLRCIALRCARGQKQEEDENERPLSKKCEIKVKENAEERLAAEVDIASQSEIGTFSLLKVFSSFIEEGEIVDHEDETFDVDEEDRVPNCILERLGHSKELKDQLENKHLRNMLREIDNDSNPGDKLESAMQIPIFIEFAESCMGITEQDTSTSQK